MGGNVRLGKRPYKHDARTLKLARYLPHDLPAPPPHWTCASQLPPDIGMMGNDAYGDCTIAGVGHMIESWTSLDDRGVRVPSRDEVVAEYLKLSPDDQGCVLLDVLRSWRKGGLLGDSIDAFVEAGAGDLAHARLGIYLTGGLYIGVALPDEGLYGPWDGKPTGPRNPENGHCVVLLGYSDERREFQCATWGQVVPMSYDWFQAYNDESWVVLDKLAIAKSSNLSLSGFRFEQLRADLAAFR